MKRNRIVGALFIIGWNIAWTSILMAFIKYVLRIPLRLSEEELLAGSQLIHNEEPYDFESFEPHVQPPAPHYIKRSEIGPSESGASAVIVGQDPKVNNGSVGNTQEIKLD